MSADLIDVLCELRDVLQANARLVPEPPQSEEAKKLVSVCLMIGFDEFQDLEENSEKYIRFRQGFGRILALVEQYSQEIAKADTNIVMPKWSITFPILSTQSRLHELTDERVARPSDRSRHMTLLPPYIAFPFDVFPAEPEAEPLTLLKQCSAISHLSRLGRPLYSFSILRSTLMTDTE